MSEEKAPAFVSTPEQDAKLKEILSAHAGEKESLIAVLHEVQEIYGYLPKVILQAVADALKVSLAEVYGVVTFYTQFSLNPKGTYKIGVCLGTACYVKGSGDIINKIKEILGIDAGECTADGKFSLDATRCIGACGLAPVMTINDDVYGKITADDVPDILAKY